MPNKQAPHNPKFALLISFLSFWFFYFSFDWLARTAGIETFIDFGETRTVTRGFGRDSYDEESDGSLTDVGFYIIVISIMLAWRVYHSIISRRLNGDLRPDQNISWIYWAGGFTSYIILSTPFMMLPIYGIIQRAIALGIAAGVFWYLKPRYDASIRKVNEEAKPENTPKNSN